MKVLESYHDLSTGESGQREIELADVVSEDEQKIRDEADASVYRDFVRKAELERSIFEKLIRTMWDDPEVIEWEQIRARTNL